MGTPNSSATPYLTAAGFLEYYDARTVGDLCSDTGTRLTPTQLTAPAPVLQQLLLSASGQVEAACLVSGRYQPADLAGLTGAAQAYLQQLVADLTIGGLIKRRPDKRLPLPPQYVEAQQVLQQLLEGARIFGLVEVQNAGNLSAYQELASDVYARDLVQTQARRFFGRRVDSSPDFPNPAG